MNNRIRSIEAIPALKDNYIWSITTNEGLIIVDPGDANPVLSHLNAHNQKCIGIFITHHHLDHIGGVDDLYAKDPNIKIYGPESLKIQSPIIPAINNISVVGVHFDILTIPGHTLDHVAYYDGAHLFVGDTLFSAGCGRVFEGTHQQMLDSLDTLNALPGSTKVFCAHEYTLNNLKFAKMIEPDNVEIDKHIQKIQSTSISLPSTLHTERMINPFLRLDEPAMIKELAKYHFKLNSRLDVFSALRQMKDDF